MLTGKRLTIPGSKLEIEFLSDTVVWARFHEAWDTYVDTWCYQIKVYDNAGRIKESVIPSYYIDKKKETLRLGNFTIDYSKVGGDF